MSKKDFKKLFLLSSLYALLSLMSASVNWLFQFATVVLLGIGLLFYTFSFISKKWYINLIVLLPFYLIYIPASIYLNSLHTYPIWIFGILISVVSYILLLNKIHLLNYILFNLSATILILIFFFPNYYSHLNTQNKFKNFILDKFEVYDAEGGKISIVEFKGKVVLFDIWHTACRPCIENFPKLESLLLRLGSDTNVVIATLNIPIDRENDKTLAKQYTEKYKFKKFYFKNSQVANSIGIETVPIVLIFDKNFACTYSGSLNYGSNVFIGNIERIINNLKSDRK